MEKSDSILKKTPVMVTLAILCQILWGIVFPVIKKSYGIFGISDIGSTLRFASLRFMIAGVILILVSIAKERKFPDIDRKSIYRLLMLGTIQTGIVYGAQFTAMLRIPSINCSIINGLSPVINLFWANLMFQDDRITFRKASGALLGLSGVLFCFLFDYSSSTITLAGEGLMLLSVITFGLGANYSRKASTNVGPMVASGFNLLIGGIELYAASAFLHGSIGRGTPSGWGMLLFLAGVSSVCLLLWTALGSANGVGKITIYQSVNPIAGAVAAALIVGESILEMKYIVSIILVVLSIVVMNTKSRK